MKYFLDQEFIEGFHKPWFGKRRHFIDLISIAIVAEDGRKYSEYEYSKANTWVVDNVIKPLYNETVPEYLKNSSDTEGAMYFTLSNFHKSYGKPIQQIAREIFLFVNPQAQIVSTKNGYHILSSIYPTYDIDVKPCDVTVPNLSSPIFYGYYADYDWVLFCSLFGTMNDLPKGFPMYCRDLKQCLDDLAKRLPDVIPTKGGTAPLYNFEKKLEWLMAHPFYPINKKEHDCESDAQFNKDLYRFIEVYKQVVDLP